MTTTGVPILTPGLYFEQYLLRFMLNIQDVTLADILLYI